MTIRHHFAFFFFTFILAGGYASAVSADILKNTPFDPKTWNPRDWVDSNPPKAPIPEVLRVRNLGTEVVHFCYGDGRNISGWATVKPGQTVIRKIHVGSKHLAYILLEKRGKEVPLKRPSIYAPYHRNKKFNIRYRGKDEWDVDIPGQKLKGRFHRASFPKIGLSGGKFYKLPVEKDGAHTVSVR